MKNALNNENLKLNLFFNIVYQVVTVLTPLIVIPKLSRVFGPSYIGLKSYTFSIVYYFAVFGVLGLDMYGQRKIALEKDDIERRSSNFWTIYLTRFILVSFSLFLFVVYFINFSKNPFEKFVFSCWTIYLVREMINPIWFLQGLEKFTLLSVCEILSQIAYVSCVYLFVNQKEQLPLYVCIYTIIPLLISLNYFIIVLRHVNFVKIKKNDMFLIIKESFVYFVPTIATAIYSMADKTMLGVFDVYKVSTGLYESTEKLIKVALAISTSSFTIIRTRMSYLYGKGAIEQFKYNSRKFISFSMFLCWPILFAIVGIVEDFVPIFWGQGFNEVIVLSYLFVLIIPALIVSGLLQAMYIFPLGLQGTMNLYYVIIATLNVVMNLILISYYGIWGAIISSILAESLLAVILIIKARKIIETKFFLFYSWKYILAAVFMLGAMKFVSVSVDASPICKLCFEFIIAVVTYFSGCILLRDNFVVTQSRQCFLKCYSFLKS